MLRTTLWSAIGGMLIVASGQSSVAVTVSIDPAAPWLGYMNVSDLPANGGAFRFGSPWAPGDLVATFSGPVLTLTPNTIGDPDPYWYTPSGGPGAVGNKIMEANMYVEVTDGLAGQEVTFTGTVLSNSLTTAHVAVAFIKDFAPDYSSFTTTTVPLTPGDFSLTLNTDPALGRHVQYGFATTGPNVWFTDVGNFGLVTLTAAGAAGLPGDYNEDDVVDSADYTIWRDNDGAASALPNDNTAGVGSDDYDRWVANFGASAPAELGASSAVPEPATVTCALLAAALGISLSVRRKI